MGFKLYNFMDMSNPKIVEKRKNIIGLIDADLNDNYAQHPNLALMKISAYYKNKGYETKLLLDYDDLDYPKIFMSKAFSKSRVRIPLEKYPQIEYGGTGFFFDKAKDLPDEIEHFMPDYKLYNDYVKLCYDNEKRESRIKPYTDFSIGFTTRGCFRKCDFCVNKKYDKSFAHSPVNEFLDVSKPNIRLWDDNFLSYAGWEKILEELNATGKKFIFQQGLDLRLMSEHKAELLTQSNYFEHRYIFAFDNYDDRERIISKLEIWRKYMNMYGKRQDYYAIIYVLCGFKSIDEKDIWEIFKRIEIGMKYNVIPYIMKFENWEKSEYKEIYKLITGWCNSKQLFLKESFDEFFKYITEGDATTNSDQIRVRFIKRRSNLKKLYDKLINYNSEFKRLFSLKFEEVKQLA